MVDRIPAFNDEGLLDRVRMAAQDAELGGHREVFVRMLPRICGETVICGLLTAGLVVAAVALFSESLTRTDQTGGKGGNVVGLWCVAPFALLFGFAFVVNLYKSLFGPATSSCSSLARHLVAENRGPGAHPAPRPAPSSSDSAPDDFRLLLTMVMGNNATAERLIAYERENLPGADRATGMAKAIERLRRDRQRPG